MVVSPRTAPLAIGVSDSHNISPNSARRVNQTYRAVRVVEGSEINYSYAVWCTGEHEIYDLNVGEHLYLFSLGTHSRSSGRS